MIINDSKNSLASYTKNINNSLLRKTTKAENGLSKKISPVYCTKRHFKAI